MGGSFFTYYEEYLPPPYPWPCYVILHPCTAMGLDMVG